MVVVAVAAVAWVWSGRVCWSDAARRTLKEEERKKERKKEKEMKKK